MNNKRTYITVLIIIVMFIALGINAFAYFGIDIPDNSPNCCSCHVRQGEVSLELHIDC